MYESIPKQGEKYDIERLDELFAQKKLIAPSDVKELIDKAKGLFEKEKNLVEVKEECFVNGDIHGDYTSYIKERDYLNMRNSNIMKIYLGDYVDRGQFSCEVLISLLCEKCNKPDKILMLRGNHETMYVSEKYGFIHECTLKYGLDMYKEFISLFNTLPLCCLVTVRNTNFFLCHGGLSPQLNKLSDIDRINRFREPDQDGFMCDLIWSDPNRDNMFSCYCKNYMRRGKSVLYGKNAVTKFLEENNLKCIIRAHECFPDGIDEVTFGEEEPLVITVFGSVRYEEGNIAGCLFIKDDEYELIENVYFDGDEWTKADGICTVQDITTNKEKNELDVYLQDFMYILERMTKRIIASALK